MDEIEEINKEEFEKKTGYKINLETLHKKYKELLYIEDTNRIDTFLAVCLSRRLPGIPLWLIFVGPSGDMKSVQLNSIEDNEDVYVLHNLTSKTLVNGWKNKIQFPDLAPKLDGKIVIVPDMAQILKLPPNEKGELWGQLRDLYDGYAGKESGQGSSAKYKDLKVTLLAGSTPAIDGQILINQDLGTREMIYRTSGNKNKEKVMAKCFENESEEKKIKEELGEVTNKFLRSVEPKNFKVSEEVLYEIKKIALYTSYMRSNGEFDSYTNELRNYVYPEEPTRISKQLKRLYICLKSLDENYSDEKALKILWHIGKSSAFPVRVKILDFLRESSKNEYNDEKGISTSGISEALKIGKSTAKRECSILENIGIVSCLRVETSYPDKFYEYWKLSLNSSTNILYTIDDIYTYIIFLDAFGVKDKRIELLSRINSFSEEELKIAGWTKKQLLNLIKEETPPTE